MIDHDGRFIRLAGADNVRDLGGLPAADGHFTRHGRLLRGEFTPSLAEADLSLLVTEMGLRTVVDLRTRSEVRTAPGSWLAHAVTIVHCPLPLVAGDPVPGADDDLLTIYLGFLEAGPAPLVRAVHVLIDQASHPALFHCAAGKDRTGALSAILLDLLGVPREVNAQDYALTGPRIERIFARLSEIEFYRERLAEVSDAARSADESTVLAFLQAVDQRHGGTEAWLVEQGIKRGELERFREVMLVDSLPGD